MRDLKGLFHARSVAVVGASRSPEKAGHIILRNLIAMGYQGEIYPVNPNAREILGYAAYPSLEAVGKPVDVVVILIPAKPVPQVMREAARIRARWAVVFTSGFRETGNLGLEEEMLDAARAGEIGVVGPNSQGINYPGNRLCLGWPPIRKDGKMAIISQSGTVAAALAMWAEKEEIGISGLASLGNRCDVDESDFLGFFGDDPGTGAIALYIEGVRDGQKFMDTGRRVVAKKPVVVFRSGRTFRARRAVESHTGSLAGKAEVFDAVVRKLGMIKAETIDDLYDFAKGTCLFPRRRGNRIQVLTSSGGIGILVTDMAESMGLDIAPLRSSTKEKLNQVLPSHCIIGNPLDLTGDTDAERYKRAVLAIAEEEPEIDLYLLIFGDPIPRASEISFSLRKTTRKAIVACYIGGGNVQEAESRKMNEGGIPTFLTPERSVRAARAILQG